MNKNSDSDSDMDLDIDDIYIQNLNAAIHNISYSKFFIYHFLLGEGIEFLCLLLDKKFQKNEEDIFLIQNILDKFDLTVIEIEINKMIYSMH